MAVADSDNGSRCHQSEISFLTCEETEAGPTALSLVVPACPPLPVPLPCSRALVEGGTETALATLTHANHLPNAHQRCATCPPTTRYLPANRPLRLTSQLSPSSPSTGRRSRALARLVIPGGPPTLPAQRAGGCRGVAVALGRKAWKGWRATLERWVHGDGSGRTTVC